MKIGRRPIAIMTLSAMGLALIAGNEGFREKTYKDTANIDTIGYGFTEGVKPGQTITPDRALVRLVRESEKRELALKRCIPSVNLWQNEYDVFVDHAYNIGETAFCKSKIAAFLRAGEYAKACAALKDWIYVGSTVDQGLVNRRERSYQKCLDVPQPLISTTDK